MPDSLDAQRANRSVAKAASLLRAAADRPGLTVTQLARSAGLPRATAVRMVEALVGEGLLARIGPRGGIAIGPELVRLARRDVSTELLVEAARVPMEALAETLRESITLTVNGEDGSVAIVHQVDGPRMIGLANWVGRPFALHASSSGKLAMASWDERRLERSLQRPLERLAARTICDPARLRSELERVREQGYAEIEDELEDGLAALSVPIRLGDVAVGSINVSGPTSRLDAAERLAALPHLRAAASAIAWRASPAGRAGSGGGPVARGRGDSRGDGDEGHPGEGEA